MKGNLWAVAALFIGLVVLAPAVNLAFTDSVTYTANETTTVDYDTNYTLANDDAREYPSLNVSTDDTVLTNSTDYTFDRPNATIDWNDTAATTDGETAYVNYTYVVYDEATKVSSKALGAIAIPLGFIFLMVVVGLILNMLPEGGGGW